MNGSNGDAALARLDRELLITVGIAPDEAGPADLMHAVAQAPRGQLAERWVETQAAQRTDGARRVYYLSM